jgi:hypothetical protein
MATKKIQAKLKVAGEILAEFQNTHFLNQATDLQQALELLDQAIKDLEQTEEDLSAQIDGENDLFQTNSSFTNLQVFLNGLEQTLGEKTTISSSMSREYGFIGIWKAVKPSK